MVITLDSLKRLLAGVGLADLFGETYQQAPEFIGPAAVIGETCLADVIGETFRQTPDYLGRDEEKTTKYRCNSHHITKSCK